MSYHFLQQANVISAFWVLYQKKHVLLLSEDLLISYSKISSYQCYKTACSYKMRLSNHCSVLIWWQKICVYCLLYIMERIETNDRWFCYKIINNNNTQMRNRNINESNIKCNLYKSECTKFMAYLFIISLQQ